jgi:hypothetical protein
MHLEGATRGRELHSKMATEERRLCWEDETRSMALFEKRLKEKYWDIDAIRNKVAEMNK